MLLRSKGLALKSLDSKIIVEIKKIYGKEKFEVETKFEKIILLTKGTHLKWAKNSIID